MCGRITGFAHSPPPPPPTSRCPHHTTNLKHLTFPAAPCILPAPRVSARPRPRPRASPMHSARHSLSTVAIPGWSGSLISPVLGRVPCAQSAPLDANTECQGADRDQRHPNPTRSPRTFRAWELSDSPPPASPHQLRDVRQPSVPRRRRHCCPLPGPRTLSAPSTAATVSCL